MQYTVPSGAQTYIQELMQVPNNNPDPSSHQDKASTSIHFVQFLSHHCEEISSDNLKCKFEDPDHICCENFTYLAVTWVTNDSFEIMSSISHVYGRGLRGSNLLLLIRQQKWRHHPWRPNQKTNQLLGIGTVSIYIWHVTDLWCKKCQEFLELDTFNGGSWENVRNNRNIWESKRITTFVTTADRPLTGKWDVLG